jgi:hypothetical protein
MARWRWLLSAALVASAISSVATVQAEEDYETWRPVSIDEIPVPARDEIMRHVGSGELMEVFEGTWQGAPAYEGHIIRGTHDNFIWVDAAGNILNYHPAV